MPTSKYDCVHWNAPIGKWRARVTLKGKKIQIGSFFDEDLAFIAVVEFKLKHNIKGRYGKKKN